MIETDMGGAKGIGGGNLAPRYALQITDSFRRHDQPFQPLLGDGMFHGPLVFQDFKICH